MANANVIELETCLEQSLAYCEANAGDDFVKFYQPRLQHAKARWDETVRESDAAYLAWHADFRDDRIRWKKLGQELKATQNMLRKVNAIGYPDATVRHWDEEILTAAVREMLDYLAARTDVLELAAERMETLTRRLDAANNAESDQEHALQKYKRHVLFRAEALLTLNSTIAEFRIAFRRQAGKRSKAYQSIRWPMSIAPDEPVL